eukprot:1158259-Pelagomonas_calceolata.AAC.1
MALPVQQTPSSACFCRCKCLLLAPPPGCGRVSNTTMSLVHIHQVPQHVLFPSFSYFSHLLSARRALLNCSWYMQVCIRMSSLHTGASLHPPAFAMPEGLVTVAMVACPPAASGLPEGLAPQQQAVSLISTSPA